MRLQGRAEGEGNESGKGSVWASSYAIYSLLADLKGVKERLTWNMQVVTTPFLLVNPPTCSQYGQQSTSTTSRRDTSPVYRISIAPHPAYQFDYFL